MRQSSQSASSCTPESCLVSFFQAPSDAHILFLCLSLRRGGVKTTYQALSDKFALPTYIQPPGLGSSLAPTAATERTYMILLCISSPSRVLTQSRTRSVGKLGDRHHLACTQIVPAAYQSAVALALSGLARLRRRLRLRGSWKGGLGKTHPSSTSTLDDCLVCWEVDTEVLFEPLRRAGGLHPRFPGGSRRIFFHAIITYKTLAKPPVSCESHLAVPLPRIRVGTVP